MTSLRRRGAALVACALPLTAACAPQTGAPGAAPRPSVSALTCAQPRPAPALTTLDWESARQQTVPDAAPPGWSAEYDTSLARPQIRVVHPPEPVRAGGSAARFELRRDDPVINDGTRAELATPLEPQGANRWYAFSLYLPKDYRRDRSPEILAQWHQDASISGNPPLAIATYRGQWEILVAGDGTEADGEQTLAGAYRTGRWTNWLIHVKWSTGPAGVIQIWRDGTAVPGYADRRGPNTYAGEKGNYLKVGIYKWDWSLGNPSDTTSRVVYLDELRIATTRAGVATPEQVPPACYRPDTP